MHHGWHHHSTLTAQHHDEILRVALKYTLYIHSHDPNDGSRRRRRANAQLSLTHSGRARRLVAMNLHEVQ